MALCLECDARIEYTGDGSTRDYTFPFEYDDKSEVYVSVYDKTKTSFVTLTQGTDWNFINTTTVRLAKPYRDTIVIFRCTDLSQMDAIFAAGNPIKARELNEDFDQLRHAIQEGRCANESLQGQIDEGWDIWLNRIDADKDYKGHPGDLVKSRSKLWIDDDHVASTKWIDNRYWDQCEETTYSYDDWFREVDDVHVPTTQAVEQRLADLQALQGVQKVTGEMQRNQRWDRYVTDDRHVATTDALVERHDVYLADNNTQYPSTYWLQPGKLWVKEDSSELFFRKDSGTQWIQLDTKGDAGEKGQDGLDGAAATVNVGTTTTGAPGTDAIVVNSGTESAAILDFTIPRGEIGEQGEAATITIGSTTTGAPGTDAEVINVGTPQEVVLEFTIPKGEKGDPGDGVGEILTFTNPLTKTGTIVSIDLQTLPDA